MRIETVNVLDKGAGVAVVIAIYFAMLGVVLLGLGALALGGLALWASGFNAHRAISSRRRQ